MSAKFPRGEQDLFSSKSINIRSQLYAKYERLAVKNKEEYELRDRFEICDIEL